MSQSFCPPNSPVSESIRPNSIESISRQTSLSLWNNHFAETNFLSFFLNRTKNSLVSHFSRIIDVAIVTQCAERRSAGLLIRQFMLPSFFVLFSALVFDGIQNVYTLFSVCSIERIFVCVNSIHFRAALCIAAHLA